MKIFRVYFNVAAILLFITASAKLYSAMGTAGILEVFDPVFFISNRSLLALVGLLECGVGLSLLYDNRAIVKAIVLAWLSLGFVAYRIAIWCIKPAALCPCLGTLTGRLPLKPAMVNLLLEVLIGFFLVGSTCVLVSDCVSRYRGLRVQQGQVPC